MVTLGAKGTHHTSNNNNKTVLKRRILNSHLFWLNSHPFFARPIICRLYNINFKYIINNFSSKHQGGGADTLKFNLHIIGRAKKGCEFNQKRCEFKIFLEKLLIILFEGSGCGLG